MMTTLRGRGGLFCLWSSMRDVVDEEGDMDMVLLSRVNPVTALSLSPTGRRPPSALLLLAPPLRGAPEGAAAIPIDCALPVYVASSDYV